MDLWEDSLFSVGSAEEYHVFVFELAESDLAQVKFHNRWVVEPENLAEANGIRNFIFGMCHCSGGSVIFCVGMLKI